MFFHHEVMFLLYVIGIIKRKPLSGKLCVTDRNLFSRLQPFTISIFQPRHRGIKRNGKLSGFVQSAMFDTRSAEYSTKVFW